MLMTKKIRATIICIMTFIFVFNSMPMVFASVDYPKKTVKSFSEADKIESMAIKERDRKILQGDIKIKSEEISPQYVDPGIGATRVIEDAWSTGYLYMDDEKYGIGDLIWDALLTIPGYFTTTVGNILLDIADLFFDIVDTNHVVTARLYHSYYYKEKLAQVWIEDKIWKTYYTSRNREWYKHKFGSYVNTAGATRTYTIDETWDMGYPPIHIDVAPHYYDETYLTNQAYERWAMGLPAGFEDWTGVKR